MNAMKTFAIAAILSVVGLGNAMAATFTVFELKDGQTAISMNGETAKGDHDRFVHAVRQARKDVDGFSNLLFLRGPGGLAIEGDAIAKDVKAMGMTTVVVKDSVCASACANIWLAGKTRVFQKGADLGWHFGRLKIEALDDIKNEWGWNGIRHFMKSNAAEDVLQWIDLGILDIRAFVADMPTNGRILWATPEMIRTVVGGVVID